MEHGFGSHSLYLFKVENIFVLIARYICSNCKFCFFTFQDIPVRLQNVLCSLWKTCAKNLEIYSVKSQNIFVLKAIGVFKLQSIYLFTLHFFCFPSKTKIQIRKRRSRSEDKWGGGEREGGTCSCCAFFLFPPIV